MRLYPRAGYEEPLSVGVLYVTVEEGRQVVVSVVFPRKSIPAGELETYDRMVAGMTIERASGGALPIIAVAVIALILLGAGGKMCIRDRRRTGCCAGTGGLRKRAPFWRRRGGRIRSTIGLCTRICGTRCV